MTSEDADAVIRRMVTSFPSPTHLRNNPEGYRHALDVYRSALSRFGRETLQKGWQKAAAENDVWCWPKCSDIVAACEAARPRGGGRADAWAEGATAMVEAYLKRFLRTSAHATKARDGGYEPELKAYVREAGWVQAQMILGRAGVAYRSPVLFAHCPDDREAYDAFFGRCRRQADSGEIKVTVPPQVVRCWRESHEPEGRGR